MPTVKDPNTIALIAQNYIATGQNKTQALIDAGYSKSYANSGLGHKLYENIQVQEAIQAKMVEIEALGTVEIEEIVAELRKLAFNQAKLLNNADRLRALELLGRYKAMFTDKYQDTSQAKPALTPAEQARYKLLAQHLSKPEPDEPGKAAG